MDATVCDKVLESDASRLTTNRIEAGENNRFRGVVDNQVHTGNLLEGADIATLATDRLALKVIGRNMHRGDGNLSGMVGSAALDGKRDQLPERSYGTRP